MGRSLAARLGYGPEDRLLIVQCDDLGVSHGANAAIHQALAQGVATGAGLMVPCPWAHEAVHLCRGLPVGVHLTLTSEYPGYRWRGLTTGASLHDEDGFLSATAEAAFARIDLAEARAECRAQIETALAWGVDVTHLDAHMDVVQGRTDLYGIYLDLAEAFRLPVRMSSRAETARQGFAARDRAGARGVLFTDHLLYPWPRRTREVFFEAIPALPPGVTEIFAHPVEDGDELRAYGPRHADLRAEDARCLVDPDIRDLLDRHRIRRISYRALRDLQRAG